MLIKNDTIVTLTWTVRDSLQNILSQLTEPTEFYLGGDDLLPKIEVELQKHQIGDSFSLYLEPHDAYGEYHKNLVTFEQRSLFPAELNKGMSIESANFPSGVSNNIVADQIYTVTDVFAEYLVFDANHPLAGIAILIDLSIHASRQPSQEELLSKTVALSPIQATLTVN